MRFMINYICLDQCFRIFAESVGKLTESSSTDEALQAYNANKEMFSAVLEMTIVHRQADKRMIWEFLSYSRQYLQALDTLIPDYDNKEEHALRVQWRIAAAKNMRDSATIDQKVLRGYYERLQESLPTKEL